MPHGWLYQVAGDVDKQIIAEVKFWPNKNGTLVDIKFEGRMTNAKASQVDWAEMFKGVEKNLQVVMNQ